MSFLSFSRKNTKLCVHKNVLYEKIIYKHNLLVLTNYLQ